MAKPVAGFLILHTNTVMRCAYLRGGPARTREEGGPATPSGCRQDCDGTVLKETEDTAVCAAGLNAAGALD
ncbi:hypothetical protein GCM10023195_07080 [Actinoallomurus liliacearum]|uniref:Uncharacterized protein n=1 Tax=Actinoallomurus liliacearum TaxID=1080073 RepID=A0ABP8TA88_9ACTN